MSFRLSGSRTSWIAVLQVVVYAAVADLTRMGEWSPENCGGHWLQGDAATVGATFFGRNRGPQGEWETTLTVTEAEPPARFAFTVAEPGEVGTTWHYEFRSERGGTAVTEAFEWYWTPLPDENFRSRVGRLPIEDAVIAVADRERHLRNQVDRTLAALKSVLEDQRNAVPSRLARYLPIGRGQLGSRFAISIDSNQRSPAITGTGTIAAMNPGLPVDRTLDRPAMTSRTSLRSPTLAQRWSSAAVPD